MLRKPHFLWLFFLLGFSTCVDPVVPAYNYLSGFVFIEGEVTDKPGETTVRISESSLIYGQYTSVPVSGATVKILDNQGGETLLTVGEIEGAYQAPENFAGSPDREYRMDVILPDGRNYRSGWEKLPAPIPMDTLYADFDPEYEYDENKDKFTPAHRIRADWQDPPGIKNYYEWRFRVYKEALFCASCFGAVYRNGECIRVTTLPASYRYDYLCYEPCWTISFGEKVDVFSDEFVDGNQIKGREVGAVIFDTHHPILVVVSQYAITLDHYRFKLLLKNLSSETGGLNATPPAAIIGNIVNANDPEEKVLGYFGASANRSRYIFIDRTFTPGAPTGGYQPNLEPAPPPPGSTPQAPCVESATRTGTKPEGWPN